MSIETATYYSWGTTRFYRYVYKLTTPGDISTAVLLYKQQDFFHWCTITFSDDWYKMFSCDWTKTKQYNLTIPFDMRTAVDSGKENNNPISNWSTDWRIGYGIDKQYQLT